MIDDESNRCCLAPCFISVRQRPPRTPSPSPPAALLITTAAGAAGAVGPLTRQPSLGPTAPYSQLVTYDSRRHAAHLRGSAGRLTSEAHHIGRAVEQTSCAGATLSQPLQCQSVCAQDSTPAACLQILDTSTAVSATAGASALAPDQTSYPWGQMLRREVLRAATPSSVLFSGPQLPSRSSGE